MHSSSEGSISPESRLSRDRRIRVKEVWSGSDPQMMPESSDPRLVRSSLFLLSLSFPPWASLSTFPVLNPGTSAEPAPLPSNPAPLLVLLLRLLLVPSPPQASSEPVPFALLLLLLLLLLLQPIPRVMAGVLVGFVEEDWMILVHIVVPRMEFVHKVFSDSALGDDTSTSGIRWRALSKLRFL